MKKTCSKTFRDLVFQIYPSLDLDESYQRHIQRLLFSTQRDEEGRALIGRNQIARDEEKTHLLKSKRYSAIAFLKEFQQTVMDEESYKWSDYSYAEHKCRVAKVKFDDVIEAALIQELRGDWADDERVYFVGGGKFSPSLQRKELKASRVRASQTISLLDCECSREIQAYMNNLPPNRFTKIMQNWQEAKRAANHLAKPQSQASQLRVLDAIRDQPVPVYKVSDKGNTVRLFSDGESVLSLKSEIRRILTQGWLETDLVNSQLAIAATLWNISEIKEYLEKNVSIWKDLVPALGVPLDSPLYSDCKGIVKRYLYGILFGMGKNKAKRELNQQLAGIGIKKGGQKFMTHWAIQALLSNRDRVMDEVRKEGYGETCFGKRINVKGKGRKSNIPSILAQQAQAVEMALIFPVFELAQRTDEFQICLYQFDGVSLSFKDKRPERVKLWREKIQGAVAAKAKELGVTTWLEFKD